MVKPVLRGPKKRASSLKSVEVENVDYKDTATLRKFISNRDETRARRITGVTVQEQRKITRIVKNAREMVLPPYLSSAH